MTGDVPGMMMGVLKSLAYVPSSKKALSVIYMFIHTMWQARRVANAGLPGELGEGEESCRVYNQHYICSVYVTAASSARAEFQSFL